MMVEADTRRMVANDAVFFERYMREEDKVEFHVMGRGKRPRDQLLREMGDAVCFTWNGEPVALYGIHRTTVLSRDGNPWMCATDRIRDMGVARTVLKYGRMELARLAEGYDRLWNYVYDGNTLTIRWLKWMGFVFPGNVVEIDHHPFQLFKMEAEDVYPSSDASDRSSR